MPSGSGWFVIPQFVAFVVFFIAGIAETHRLPFDLPEAESELVAGYHAEYSGLKFGMFFVGEYLGITLVSALTVVLFFGGWLGPWLPPLAWFVLKTLLFICLFILIRASLPRPRYDQLMAFAIVTVVLMAGSLNLSDIVNAQSKKWVITVLPVGPVAFFLYLFAGIADPSAMSRPRRTPACPASSPATAISAKATIPTPGVPTALSASRRNCLIFSALELFRLIPI